MKSLTQFVNEAISNKIKYKGFEFTTDVNMSQDKEAVKKQVKGMEEASHFKSLKDIDRNSLLNQGCRWIVALPPHNCSKGKVDYWKIYMFVKSQKVINMLKSDSIGAIYDLKKEEIVNKDKIKKEVKDYKVLRLD